MKFRVLIAAAVMLLPAACGSNSTGGSTGATSSNLGTAPPTSEVTLSETGSNNLYPLMSSWAGVFHSKYPNVTINTDSALSGVGIAQAAAGAVNIGASDAYLSDADIAAHQGLMNIAMAVSWLFMIEGVERSAAVGL
ncbi:MAG: substrate-binding domain-containing protein [Actinomycetota bacterium]|nr:substrate-binding domain-containing protein [Actinomycetota bacterium]